MDIDTYFALIINVILVLTLIVLFLTFLYLIYGKEKPAETAKTEKENTSSQTSLSFLFPQHRNIITLMIVRITARIITKIE